MPVITSSPFQIIPPSGVFGQGAFFNGTTSELSRTNDGIISDTLSPGFASYWVQLRPQESDAFSDSFVLGGRSGDFQQISYLVGYTHNNIREATSIRYRWANEWAQIWGIGYSGAVDTQIRSSMNHFVIEKSGYNTSNRIWLNGSLLGSTGLDLNIVFTFQNFTPTDISVGYDGLAYTEGAVKNLVFSNDVPSDAIASGLFSVGINGDITTVGGFTATAWYPFQSNFDDASGNNKHFTTTTDVVII